MNRIIIAAFAILLSATTACKQSPSIPVQTDSTAVASPTSNINYEGGARSANRLFPDKLRDLPNEIIASHFPNPCYAVLEDSMYIWKHNISIQAKEDLQIIEYGSFVYTDKGWYLRVSMSAKDFEASYHCKGGLLKKGVTYTDDSSWRRDKKLRGGDAMWYFIAKDKSGRLVKGMAPIETEGKLVNSTVHSSTVVSSDINWTGYGEVGGYSLTGNIKLKRAEITASGDTLQNATIIFDMPSLSHKDKTLEQHLKGDDFFDVAKYPEATFEATQIIYKRNDNANAKGKLTIKGVTKPIEIPLQIKMQGTNEVITGKVVVDRTLYGIKYNSKSFFGDLGDQAIKNNFDLAFSITIK